MSKKKKVVSKEREINRIIIHSSASAFGNSALIDSWHRNNGWDSVGYHYVILNGKLDAESEFDAQYDGHPESGRHDNVQGAHCKGENGDSIGICLIGMPFSYTNNQYKTLAGLIKRLQSKYMGANIFFHSEYNKDKPQCPGISAVDLLQAMADG